MDLRRLLSQVHRWFPPRLRRRPWWTLILLILVIHLSAGPALAETEDVYVLYAGGIDRLDTVTVHSPVDAPAHLRGGNSTTLSLNEGGLAAYSDITVMPDGSILLASLSGHGVMHFDTDGHEIDRFHPAANTVASAVAAGFLAPGDPDLLLLSHDDPGRIRLFDTLDAGDRWMVVLGRDDAQGQMARSIVLPGDRVASAVSWPPLGLSALEIASVDDPNTVERIVWSHAHPDDGPGDPVAAGIHPVRDLMADRDGRMLVTGADQISIVDPDSGLLWAFSLGDAPTLGGEFQSARWTDTGLIVAALRQPGLWTQPHVNHRVLLIDPDADDPLLDYSHSLPAAPVALESARGVAATGTLHYDADAFADDEGDLSLLTISDGPSLEPGQPGFDESTSLSFTITNEGDESVSLRRVEFRTASTDCDDVEAFLTTWWSQDLHLTLAPGDQWHPEGEVLRADQLSVGAHCGRLNLVGRNATNHLTGPLLLFEILSPDGQGQVIVDELGSHDEGSPDGDPGLGDGDGASSGCACSSTPASTAPLFVLFWVAVAIGRRCWKIPTAFRTTQSPPL